MQGLCNFWNVKIVWALCIGTGKACYKAGIAMEKALDTVLVLGEKNVFKFVKDIYFEHFGRTSKSGS